MKVQSAALLLCLLSVCRAAPLTCDQLLTDQSLDLDLSGRWYVHGMTFDSCFYSAVVDLLKPSVALDFSLKETPKQYEMITLRFKWLSSCINHTKSFEIKKNMTLLPSSCSDCIVVKLEPNLALLSRNPAIDVADLEQFETQAACAGLQHPYRLNSDYDFSTCKDTDFTDEEEAILEKRLETFIPGVVKCVEKAVAKSWENFMSKGVKYVEEGVTTLAKTLESYIPEPVKNGWNWIQSFTG